MTLEPLRLPLLPLLEATPEVAADRQATALRRRATTCSGSPTGRCSSACASSATA